MVGDEDEPVAIWAPNGSIVRLAQPRCALTHGVEHVLNVGRRARDGSEDLTGRVLLLQRLPNLPLCFGKLPPSLVSVVPRLVKLAGARFELLFQLDRWIGLVANARSRLRSGRTKFAARWTICAFARQDHLVGTVTGPPFRSAQLTIEPVNPNRTAR